MAEIHPSSVLEGDIELGEGVRIGPFCHLVAPPGMPIRLGDGVHLMARVSLYGPLTIGPRTRLCPGATVGLEGQDFKFTPGDPTGGVVIGADCILREGATVHAATAPDRVTRVGDGVFLMLGAHVGHDAHVGDRAILVNNVSIGGHARVGNNVNMGGLSAVHQHVRVGRLAMIGGLCGITADVPPFFLALSRGQVIGINRIGLRRAGVPRDEITQLTEMYRRLFRASMPRQEIAEALDDWPNAGPLLREVADFVRETTGRSLARHAQEGPAGSLPPGNLEAAP